MPELRSRPRRNRLVDNANADEIVNVRGTRARKLKDDQGVKENINKKKVSGRVLEVEGMNEYDSGGRSADKAPEAEDEGTTPPIPEKVHSVSHFATFSLLHFLSLFDYVK